MFEGFSKRGQEGITLTTLLLIILGVVVVVVIILGATGGLNFVFDKINLVPGQSLEAVTQSCSIAAKNSLRADYCNEFKEITLGGEKQFVNCQAPEIVVNLQGNTIDDCKNAQGTAVDATAAGKGHCVTLVKAGKASASTRVNGVLCGSEVHCTIASLGAGAYQPADKATCKSGELKITKGFAEASAGVCCITQ